jgi:hypothetical protein
MTSMTLLWTTLPAGIRRIEGEWHARFSVFISPRLEGLQDKDLTLSDFPKFVDWPATLRAASSEGIGFVVQVSDGHQVIAETTVRPLASGAQSDAPDSTAWRSIFPETTTVQAFDAPKNVMLTARRVDSYPAGEIVVAIREAYGDALAYELGVDPKPPELSAFKTAASTARASGRSGNGSPIEQFVRFHRRSEKTANRRLKARSDDCADFHQTIAALGTHPRLMRKLGLVLDIDIPAANLGLDVPDRDLRIRVVPVDANFSGASHACHWTAIEYDTAASDTFRIFAAAHRKNVVRGGFQALGGAKMSIALEKIEHAAFALIQHRQQVLGEREPLPALLQGGMRLTRADIPATIATAMVQQSQLEQTLGRRKLMRQSGVLDCPVDAEPLYAEDLTRGHRIDVRDAPDGHWRSLCRRQVRYQSGDWFWPAADGSVEDEGVIEPVVYKDDNADQSALRTTEDLFEWDGWSLVVPRPDHPGDDSKPVFDGCRPDGKPPFSAQFEVPAGSLQPQRFGRCYQFRARAVDLAGNSLTSDEADAIASAMTAPNIATDPVCCLRVESAKPPVVFRAQPRGPGEAGDIIVLRDAELPQHRTETFRVHVLPPEVPLRIAEKHGTFDGMSAEDSWRLIHEHRGKLSFESPEDESADERKNGKRTIKEPSTAKEIYTPYLPDPMVTRAVLVLPDGTGRIDMPAFDDLPRHMQGRELARSCSLVVRPGKTEVRARVTGRRVTLEVPRGRVQTIRIAAKLSADELSIAALARPEWHASSNGRKSQADIITRELTAAAAGGAAPLLAPSREIRIVHATQRPLTDPRFGRPLILPRALNTTTALLADDALQFDRPSTGRIDVYARWEDPIDDPNADRWRITQNEIHAGGVRIDDDDGKPFDPVEISEPARSPLSHDFGDTKHREVSYQAVATSRFVDFYPASLTGDPANVTRSSQPVTLHVPSTAPPASPDISYVVPTFRRNDSPPHAREAAIERTAEQIGEGLRVYMNRGWFSSGKAERLALVVATPRTPERLQQEVSSWGMNPLRISAPLPGPLQLKHVWGGAERFNDWSLDDGPVGLVIHDVHFSKTHGLPFADIEFLSQRSFMPFVRLALARYQEHAIDTCKLSRIVHADFVPLAPGRAVTVKKTGRANWSLTMRGYSYTEPGKSDNLTSVVQAHIEYMESALAGNAASWRPLGRPVTLTPSSVEPWRYHWTGRVRIDDRKFLSARWRRRLVIQEFELFGQTGSPDVPLAERSRLISAHTVKI